MDRQLLSDQQGGLLQSPTAAATAKYASSQGLSQQDLAAGAQQDTLHTDQQQQQAEQGAPQLTETVALGLQNMEEHRQQLHAMINELAQVGLHFLEQQRQQFLRTLESYKEDVDAFCQHEVAKGQQVSAETMNAHARLQRAQLLVQTLGGAVCQPDGAGL